MRECVVPSLVETGVVLLVLLKYLEFLIFGVFFLLLSPLDERRSLSFEQTEFHSPKDALCQICFKVTLGVSPQFFFLLNPSTKS